jgi:hypothetical protein
MNSFPSPKFEPFVLQNSLELSYSHLILRHNSLILKEFVIE